MHIKIIVIVPYKEKGNNKLLKQKAYVATTTASINR
jgi:hypothetical protein